MQSVYIKFFLTGVPLAILIASFVFPHIKIDTNVLIILLFAFLPWLPELVTKLKLGNFAQLETVQRRSTDDAKQAGTPGQSAPRTTTGPANHIAPTPDLLDPYLMRMLKLVPVDMIAMFLIFDAQLGTANVTVPSWAPASASAILFIFCLLLTFIFVFYRVRYKDPYTGKVTGIAQTAISTLGFAVWIFCIGGPFKAFDWYAPIQGAIALLLYMTLVPLLFRGETA